MNAALLVLMATLSVCVSEDTTVVGGLSPTKFATEEVQDLVDMVRDDIISQLPLGYDQERALPEFVARLYREQVVAGTNFFVKVETAPLRFIHARIHVDLTGDAHVVAVQVGKTMGDPLEYF
ncbi:cystatin-A2-like [Crassostrea virginica]